MATPAFAFDPFSPEVVADPYPAYAALHAGPRVLRQEQWDVWVVSRHADVARALRDDRLSSADGVTFLRAPLPMMLTQDPPNHERLRKIVGREFAPRDIERFRADVEGFVADGIADLVEGRTTDIVEALAIPVPIRVMAKILGVPDADIPALRQFADDLVQGFAVAPEPDSRIDDPTWRLFDIDSMSRAITGIFAYFIEAIGARRVQPTNDLVTRLMNPPSGEQLSDDELLWFCLLLLVAGIETTTNLIGNMSVAFDSHPAAWERLRADHALIPAAVNEVLRYDAPIQGFYRTARADVAVGETVIPAGSRVLLLFGAANRDPVHYTDPDEFRIERNPTDHLAFGGGIHRCLGAGLAELEGRIVLEQLLDVAGSFESSGDVVRTSNPTLRGAKSFPVDTAGWRR